MSVELISVLIAVLAIGVAQSGLILTSVLSDKCPTLTLTD